MNVSARALKLAILVAVIGVALTVPALADDTAEWIQPVSKGVSGLTTSLISIAGGIIGVCIVGFGLWSAMRGGHIEWHRIWGFLIAGLIVTVGPTAILWFIELMKSGS